MQPYCLEDPEGQCTNVTEFQAKGMVQACRHPGNVNIGRDLVEQDILCKYISGSCLLAGMKGFKLVPMSLENSVYIITPHSIAPKLSTYSSIILTGCCLVSALPNQPLVTDGLVELKK